MIKLLRYILFQKDINILALENGNGQPREPAAVPTVSAHFRSLYTGAGACNVATSAGNRHRIEHSSILRESFAVIGK